MATLKNTTLLGRITSLALLSCILSTAAMATEAPELTPRLSTSTFQGEAVRNQYPALSATTAKPQIEKRSTLNHSNDLWVYDVLINLTTDNDSDGHYSGFTVSIDVDSSFQPRTVYAVLYLRLERGEWLEYAVTSNFTVTGTNSTDSVLIETNLESGYPNGYYDHYIEIYDAYDHGLLVSYGPNQSNHLQGLPIESYYNDSYYTYGSFDSSVNVSLSFTGSGSTTHYTLTGLLALLVYRRRKKLKLRPHTYYVLGQLH